MPAVTDSYATPEKYRAATGKIDSANDLALADDLQAVSRYMELELGRFFTQDAAVVSRTYIPTNYRNLLVDDIASLSGLVIKPDQNFNGIFTDDAALAAADYQLLPLNAAYGPEPQPWDQIFLPAFTTSARYFWLPGQQVQVTAIWGWPAVPKAIERACIHLTAILRLETARATGRIQELETVFATSREAQSIVRQLMNRYAKVSV